MSGKVIMSMIEGEIEVREVIVSSRVVRSDNMSPWGDWQRSATLRA